MNGLTLKKAYEWVFKCFDGAEYVLTEKQYAYYKSHVQESMVFFDEFGFNPGAISNVFKREADAIKEKYPCKNCQTNGYRTVGKSQFEVCSVCEGTGVQP